MRRATKQKERTLMPMKPTKMGGDEDEDEEGVEVESAEAAAVLLGEGDVEDVGGGWACEISDPKAMAAKSECARICAVVSGYYWPILAFGSQATNHRCWYHKLDKIVNPNYKFTTGQLAMWNVASNPHYNSEVSL